MGRPRPVPPFSVVIPSSSLLKRLKHMRNKRFVHSDSRIPDLKPKAGILPVIAGMLHNKVNPSVRHRVFYGILRILESARSSFSASKQ